MDKLPLLLFAFNTDIKTTIAIASTLMISTAKDHPIFSEQTSSEIHALSDAND